MLTVTYDIQGKDVLLTCTGWEVLDKTYEAEMEPGTLSHIISCNKMEPLICFHDVTLHQPWDVNRIIYTDFMQFLSIMFKSNYQPALYSANAHCTPLNTVHIDHVPFYAMIIRRSANTMKCVRNIKVTA